MSNEITTITFRLPATMREKIKAQATAEDRSESSFIRRQLARALAMNEVDADTEEESQTERSVA